MVGTFVFFRAAVFSGRLCLVVLEKLRMTLSSALLL